MNKNKIMLSLLLASSTACAGTMGPIMAADKFFLVEGGVAYSHAFYKDRAIFPESITPFTPSGFAVNPNDFFPNDFFGGYAGMSFYFPGWLVNTRYTVYEHKTKVNSLAGTAIGFGPSKLSFTADRVWGNFYELSYGLGAGAVLETLNKGGAIIDLDDNNPLSESFQGRSRLDALVEAMIMYRCTNNFGTKLNVEYQIPVNNVFGHGDINVNLGINYAFPI